MKELKQKLRKFAEDRNWNQFHNPKNLAMPMCKFGCDDLFEKGYISVKDGRFIQLPKRPITEELERYTSKLKDNVCDYYSNDTKKYFDWHYQHHK